MALGGYLIAGTLGLGIVMVVLGFVFFISLIILE